MEIKEGLYKHFKGNYYYVVDTATDSETGQDVVIYQALYLRNREFTKYARPLSMFMENVERENYSGPRFEYIETAYAETIKNTILENTDNLLTEEYFRKAIKACLDVTTILNDSHFSNFIEIIYNNMDQKFRRKYL